uniref:Uncharacterized protein n=1 Tax=Strigamia maritima TaxID=126957 RepID=T1IR81_STRMM
MALPIQKFSRALFRLNRSTPSSIYIRTNTILTPAIKKSRKTTPNSFCMIPNPCLITTCRAYSAVSSDEVRKRVDSISTKFTDAVELINDAKSSMGTIYFTEDMKDAEELVAEVMNDYKTLLSSLDDKQRTDVQRTIGLKMEELKAQISILKDSIKE